MQLDPRQLAFLQLDPDLIAARLDRHQRRTVPRLQRLWRYYRNRLQPNGDLDGHGVRARRYRLEQEEGLPPRIVRPRGKQPDGSPLDRERVVENDIAWRIHTLVDFMFGKPVVIQSRAADRDRAAKLEMFLHDVFDANGGISFFQDLALLGAVYGYADILLRLSPKLLDRFPQTATRRSGVADHTPLPTSAPHAAGSGASTENTNASSGDRGPSRGAQGAGDRRQASASARHQNAETSRSRSPATPDARPLNPGEFILDLIEPTRAVPLLNPNDYRQLDAYLIHYTRQRDDPAAPTLLQRLRASLLGESMQPLQHSRQHLQAWTADGFAVFEADGHDVRLVEQASHRLGRLPLVHIQNLPQPFAYEGLSEVEPLVPLQDELNTRLSDRANRVTFQSFKMYLAKGVEKFLDQPVGPGQMWQTDNPAAEITAFGGDAASPSEDAHISEIRDALDKTSGVTPIAAGILRDKIGNLTSENALRMALMGLLARTEKKRVTYGNGIQRLCELILHAADVTGVLPNTPDERGVRIDWASPIPQSESQRLRDAEIKQRLGVPQHQLLAELGYADCVQD